MDASGEPLSQNRYKPFGEVRDISGVTNITETDFGYTGQRNIADIGLMDYNARFYSPTLMRFTQPDTIVPELFNPQAWNRYSYAYNNPISFNDPSGHCPAVLQDICEWIEEKIQSVTSWWNEVAYNHCAMSIDSQCGVLGPSISPPSPAEAVKDIVTEYTKNSAGGITQEEVDRINEIIDLTERLSELINIYGEWAVNSRDEPYPIYLDPRTGEPIPAPTNDLEIVDVEDRVTWDLSDREDFIKEWQERGYERPSGGWGEYDIHHIIPKEYGGTNDFWNLVPVERTFHQTQFNSWWSGYKSIRK
jgi:RHS repeat-associated protein